MASLLKQYYEKYALQEIDVQLKNIFFNDINTLNKLTFPIKLCLKKFGCFILTRTLFFEKDVNLFSIIHYVIYDDNVSSNYSNIVSLLKFKGIPPKSCDGYAHDNNAVVYLRVNSNELPFDNKYLQPLFKLPDGSEERERMSKEEANSVLDNIAKGITLSDCQIKCSGKDKVNVNEVISKFKPYVDELKKYYKGWQLKLNRSLSLRSDRISNALDTLEHELTHVYDRLHSHNVNYFSTVTDDDAKNDRLDKDKLNIAKNILYTLWSYTESNAYAHTYGRQDKTLSPVKIKDDLIDAKRSSSKIGGVYKSLDEIISELKNDIQSLESYDDGYFWHTVKRMVEDGSKISSTKERIFNMHTKQFKTYFIKTSYKLLEKYKEKTIKKSTQQTLYNNDSLSLAKEIRKAIDVNNSKYSYEKKKPFTFEMTFPYYFKKEKSSFNVKLLMSTNETDANMYRVDVYFNRHINITLECKKLSVKYVVPLSVLLEADSFFKLYCELLNKPQRKSYLDSIAMDMADDLRYILDKKLG